MQCLFSLPTKLFHFPFCCEDACDAIIPTRHNKTDYYVTIVFASLSWILIFAYAIRIKQRLTFVTLYKTHNLTFFTFDLPSVLWCTHLECLAFHKLHIQKVHVSLYHIECTWIFENTDNLILVITEIVWLRNCWRYIKSKNT